MLCDMDENIHVVSLMLQAFNISLLDKLCLSSRWKKLEDQKYYSRNFTVLLCTILRGCISFYIDEEWHNFIIGTGCCYVKGLVSNKKASKYRNALLRLFYIRTAPLIEIWNNNNKKYQSLD